jgi:hypothetical protein
MPTSKSSCPVTKAFAKNDMDYFGHGLRTTDHDHLKTQILFSSQPLAMSVKQPLYMMEQSECYGWLAQ